MVSAFAATGWLYAKVIRLHDIIYFIWRGKYQISWVLLKVVTALAVLGFIFAILYETVQEWMPQEALPPHRLRYQKNKGSDTEDKAWKTVSRVDKAKAD